jgi:hypothetical protein
VKINQRTGYGIYDLSRQVARRARKEWESVESPPLPRRLFGEVVAFPDRRDPWPPPADKRPQAA